MYLDENHQLGVSHMYYTDHITAQETMSIFKISIYVHVDICIFFLKDCRKPSFHRQKGWTAILVLRQLCIYDNT